MNTKTLNQVLFQIEKNRARLAFAISERDSDAQWRLTKLIANLNAQLFELASVYAGSQTSHTADRVLLIAGDDSRGQLLTLAEYEVACERMSDIEFATHVAVDVSASMVADLERQLAEDAKAANRRKNAA